MDDAYVDSPSIQISHGPIYHSTPVKPTLKANDNLNLSFESGDVSIHFQSEHEPNVSTICWTIKDFSSTVVTPKMLSSYTLMFSDHNPKVDFNLGQSKKGILFLKPSVDIKKFKNFQNDFFKFGFTVGPHKNFNTDFTLESPIIKVKNLNKTKLDILDIKALRQSYLVDGNLNLIIRIVFFKPKTSPTVKGIKSVLGLKGDLIVSCSQFAVKKHQQESMIQEDASQLSKTSSILSVAGDHENASINQASIPKRSSQGLKIKNYTSSCCSNSTFEKFIFKNEKFNTCSILKNEEPQTKQNNNENKNNKTPESTQTQEQELSSVSLQKPKVEPVISLGKCWDRDHSRNDILDLTSANWVEHLHQPLSKTFVSHTIPDRSSSYNIPLCPQKDSPPLCLSYENTQKSAEDLSY